MKSERPVICDALLGNVAILYGLQYNCWRPEKETNPQYDSDS